MDLTTSNAPIELCIAHVEEAGRAIHQCTDNVVQLFKKALVLAENQQRATGTEGTVEDLTHRLQTIRLELDALHQMPVQMGQFRTFFVENPLQLLSDKKTWDSPIVSLGGPKGYLAGMRLIMSGDDFAHAQSVSVLFRLFPGPYDEWLRWPFPGTSVRFAMFRRSGKPPHVYSCKIKRGQNELLRPSKVHTHNNIGVSHFIAIETFLDDSDFLLKKRGPNGHDDILMVGFAVEGEENFISKTTTSLEERVERLESITATNSNIALANPRRRGYSKVDDLELDDELYCC